MFNLFGAKVEIIIQIEIFYSIFMIFSLKYLGVNRPKLGLIGVRPQEL